MTDKKSFNRTFLLIFGCFGGLFALVLCGILCVWAAVAFFGVKIGSEVYNAPATQEFLHGEQHPGQPSPEDAPVESAPGAPDQQPVDTSYWMPERHWIDRHEFVRSAPSPARPGRPPGRACYHA